MNSFNPLFPGRRPPLEAARPAALMLSPLAFLKLQFFLHAGETEIGGFGVSRAYDLLYVDDFVSLPQAVSCVTVEFDDAAAFVNANTPDDLRQLQRHD